MNIQIMKTYHESFQNVRSHKMEWLKVAFSPMLILVLALLFLGLAYGVGGHSFEIHKTLTGGAILETKDSAFMMLAHLIYQLVYFIALTSLYINGYRYAILQEGGDSWLTLNLNMRFVKMVLYTILLSILGGIYAMIAVGVILGAHVALQSVGLDIVLGLLLGLFGLYLIVRIILYPVVISMDQSEPLRTSWRLMKGNILRLIGLALLISLTILLIGVIGAAILGIVSFIFAAISPVLGILSIILWVFFGIFMILLGWALNAKMMGLVFLELSRETKRTLEKK